MQDNNRPAGLYGEVYDKQTGAKSRSNMIDRPVVGMWNEVDLEIVRIAMEEINKKLNLK